MSEKIFIFVLKKKITLMAKQTKKEIEETLRNKIAKQYTSKMENYQERIDRLAKELYDERSKRMEYQSQVEELKEKVEQYEDWIHRLQEFCDLPEGEREKAIKAYQAENEYKTHMKQLLDLPAVKMFTQMMSIYGI